MKQPGKPIRDPNKGRPLNQSATRSSVGRKPKPAWVHFQVVLDIHKAGRLEKVTSCGKTAKRIRATKNSNEVSCDLCIEILKKTIWHCPEHGFIEDAHVTNNETCEICGSELSL